MTGSQSIEGNRIGLISPLGELPHADVVSTNARHSDSTQAAWNQVTDQLLRFRLLQDDWDGQGAEAPGAANVDRALQWVREMRLFPQAIPPSRAVPGVAGELYLEWQAPPLSLSAELADPARVEWTLVSPEQSPRHWVTEFTLPYFVSALPMS